MALSRRGILFSPSVKDKRIEDYFKLPVSMQIDCYNKENKKGIVNKIVKVGKVLIREGVRVLGEFLFPRAQINFFPREFKQHDANATYIFPFFENSNLLTTTVKQKKLPPIDDDFVKQKKSKSSSSCQTDSVIFEDIEKSPFFSFNTESVKSVEWKLNGKEKKLMENLENRLTDSESLDSEMKKIKRKVIKKVKRSNLSIVNCGDLNISKVFKEDLNCIDDDQFMIIENENSYSQVHPAITDSLSAQHPEFDPDSSEPTTKKSSFFPLNPPKVSTNHSEPLEPQPNREIIQSTLPTPNTNSQPSLNLLTNSAQNTPNTIKFEQSSESLQSNPPQIPKPAETNPFLNTYSIKKTEPSFIFGSVSSTPSTVHKTFGSNSTSAFPMPEPINAAKDVEMFAEQSSSLLVPAQINLNTSIQTPNLEAPLFFTQNNICELFNKTPVHFPVLKSPGSLFTLPSNMNISEKSQFSLNNSQIAPSSTNFSLGKISTYNKKK